ncbi:MAG: DUF3347 domain-containing protein [Ferruginibacter sp.]
MKKQTMMIILLVLLAVFALYWFKFRNKGNGEGDGGVKQQALTLKKHSEKFNNSVTAAMDAYFEAKDDFVEADTTKAKTSIRKFIILMDSIPVDELKKDTAGIYETAVSNADNVKMNAESLLKQTSIKEMRMDFRGISDALFPSFFKAINYEGRKIYLQNCPMAFGDNNDANWISSTYEIFNPYLGKHDSLYKAAMVGCGSVKDSIFVK